MATTTEEPIAPIEPEAEKPAVEEPVNEEDAQPKSTKAKKAAAPKEPKAKKVPAPRKRGPSSHPPYFEVSDEFILISYIFQL